MSSNILFVFEGERTEKQITNNLKQYFINENTIIQCVYCSDIYRLHKQISSDEDLDTFILLKEISQNSEILSEFIRTDFAEIYLFFDYDGHATLAEDEKLKEVLTFFNDETGAGKIYISYPMVESIKHIPESKHFKELKVIAKQNINYKELVNTEAQNVFKQINKYSKDFWIKLIDIHLSKMNYVVNDEYVLPLNNIPQDVIFIKQLEKYISIDSTVAVLSSFPVFLFDYYGFDYISKLVHGSMNE